MATEIASQNTFPTLRLDPFENKAKASARGKVYSILSTHFKTLNRKKLYCGNSTLDNWKQ